MLVVSDGEHDVGDDEDASSDAAEEHEGSDRRGKGEGKSHVMA